jgi:hypothetical protein
LVAIFILAKNLFGSYQKCVLIVVAEMLLDLPADHAPKLKVSVDELQLESTSLKKSKKRLQ